MLSRSDALRNLERSGFAAGLFCQPLPFAALRAVPAGDDGARTCYLPPHSTVTDFARLRGWSTSFPMNTAVW
jgi:hypothetical protein